MRRAASRSTACPLKGTRPATWPRMIAWVFSGMPNSLSTSLPEPGDGGGERGGGAGELHDTQRLHGAGVRQADGVHFYARFRELPQHGSALALKRVFP